MNFLENISNKKIEVLQNAHSIAHDIANKTLKEDDAFKNKPFDWLSGMEYIGNFEKVAIEMGKINKKHMELSFDVTIPLKEAKALAEKSEEEIVTFFIDIYANAVKNAIEYYE